MKIVKILISLLGTSNYNVISYQYQGVTLACRFHQALLAQVNGYDEVWVFCTNRAYNRNYAALRAQLLSINRSIVVRRYRIFNGFSRTQYILMIQSILKRYINNLKSKSAIIDIDITHGWRIQPIVLINTLSLIDEVLKFNQDFSGIRINNIFYAAVVANNRGDIVDFTYINQLKELTRAYYLFNQTGLSSELKNKLNTMINNRNLSRQLSHVLDTLEKILTESNTYLFYSGLRSLRGNIVTLIRSVSRISPYHYYVVIILKEIKRLLDEMYSQTFGRIKGRRVRIYYIHLYLAEYAFRKGNMLTCVTQIQEGLITWYIEHINRSSTKVFNFSEREKAKNEIERLNRSNINQHLQRLLSIYQGIVNIRNPLAHAFTSQTHQPRNVRKSLQGMLDKFRNLGPPY